MDKKTSFFLVILGMVMLNVIYILARTFLPSMNKKKQKVLGIIALVVSFSFLMLVLLMNRTK
jgi:hypothetical protein